MNKLNKEKLYYSFKTDNGNQIWIATMSLVWNQIRNRLTNQPLIFQSPSKQAQAIIKALNESNLSAEVLSENSYYLKCGFGQKTVNLINRQVKKKFGCKNVLQIEEQLGDKDFISFAYICKSLKFINKFQRRRDRSFRFNDQPVDSFYAKHLQQKQQIKCYFYEDPSNFIIKIRLENDTGCLFLMKNKKIKTVRTAINTVLSSVEHKQPFTLTKTDQFQMPFINISGLKQYKQMQGLEFKNKEIQGYRVKKMFEQFRLEINQCGAILEGTGVLIGFKCPSKPAKPRAFLLDQSFWMVMQQEGQHPYFCAFIQKVSV